MNNIEGVGICWYPDGRFYHGNFFDGKSDGYGTLYCPRQGMKRTAVWHQGTVLDEEEILHNLPPEAFQRYTQDVVLFSTFIQYVERLTNK